MKRLATALLCLLAPAFLIGGIFVNSVVAQEKAKAAKSQATTKVLLENEKVRVTEVHFKPGAENPNVPRNARVVRALKGGTLLRTHPDGKTDKVEYKTGDVRFNPPVVGATPQYTAKNVGKSEIVLYIVELK
jgi:hypothetical protein